VRTWDGDDRAGDWSPPAWWEMGLLGESDWKARWIAPPKVVKEGEVDPRAPRDSFMVRGTFRVDKRIKRARAYVTGLGLYELRLNGAKVGHDIFTPGWTHYGKRLQYQTYDVTDQLRHGDNAVGAILGNGWWASGLGGDWRNLHVYADQNNVQFLMQLEIEYADGSGEAVLTGEGWRSHLSPITENTFYHGEHYDARLEQAGWDEPGFDASMWAACELVDNPDELLVAQRSPTIQVTAVLEPMHISEPDPGTYIVDFGQNAAGWMELRVNGSAGDRIQLRFGEELDPNGRLYRENYRSARATDVYICRGGGEEAWEPRFTYRGFRYCEVTGWPQADKEHPQAPRADAFRMKVVHSAAPIAGEFACSNELINSINHAIVWGQRSNMHSVPTDCPQRDERLGWTGDAQAFAITSCYNMDMASFWSKWMKDVTDVAPAAVTSSPAKPGWGDAVVIVPWVVYRYYGDTRVIEDNYATIRGWVEYMRSKSEGDLYEVEGYGDWVAPVATTSAPIGSLFYYHSTDLLAKMAGVIGKDDDAAEYAALASRIGEAFHAKHFNPETKNYWDGTQTANTLPLWFGVVPEDQRAAVLGNIVEDIRQRGYRLSTGFLGTPYLMPLLSAHGEDETAWRLAVQTAQPSWGYMVRHGATTIWERWDTDKHGPSMNSRNHFAFGVVGQWYYQALAGIRLDADVPGFKRLVIRPQPLGDLDWVKASYPTMYGQARVHWSRCRDSLHMDVTIPANTAAEIHIPTLGHGDATIREGEAIVVERGKPVSTTPSLRAISVDEHYARFDAGAGMYRFQVQWR
jgi:alpha-L-rhamnosidase